MFLGKPYIVSSQALVDTMLLHVAQQAVFEELERTPRFARKMLAGLSRRLHGLIGDVEAYSLNSGTQRVIGYLLREGLDDGEEVTLHASKAVVASRLNLTPEHFSRILHDLARAWTDRSPWQGHHRPRRCERCALTTSRRGSSRAVGPAASALRPDGDLVHVVGPQLRLIRKPLRFENPVERSRLPVDEHAKTLTRLEQGERLESPLKRLRRLQAADVEFDRIFHGLLRNAQSSSSAGMPNL